ncbi:MAG: hypothetical protein ACTSR3_18265 [Candidatus Helarchaeota archaeon]
MVKQNKNQVPRWERCKNQYNPDLCVFKLIPEKAEGKALEIINLSEMMKWYEGCEKCSNFAEKEERKIEGGKNL